jgi:hypothetical protein
MLVQNRVTGQLHEVPDAPPRVPYRMLYNGLGEPIGALPAIAALAPAAAGIIGSLFKRRRRPPAPPPPPPAIVAPPAPVPMPAPVAVTPPMPVFAPPMPPMPTTAYLPPPAVPIALPRPSWARWAYRRLPVYARYARQVPRFVAWRR